jgi:hypothetical protein
MRPGRFLSLLLLTGMILGTYQGRLALWHDNRTDPVTVYPVQISMLPKADQQRLREGISIENESRLHRLLEDYLS